MGRRTTRSSNTESIYMDDGTYVEFHESIYIEEPIHVDMSKMKDDQHLVFGWANVALSKDNEPVHDHQEDITDPEVLEKAAYSFVLKHRLTGENHQGEAVGHLVESIMFTKEKIEALGLPEDSIQKGWWVGFYVPDEEVCKKIKSGDYKMFSIQGKAKRIKF